MNTGYIKSQKGYTLLFAVLTAALVLGVAVFILSVSTKQYELSAAARNSVYSFYAADTGIECAAWAYSNGTTDPLNGAASVSCNGTTVSGAAWSALGSGLPPPLTTNVVSTALGALDFALPGSPVGTCVRIVLYDGYDSVSPTPNHYTVIEARGYNKCTGSGPDTSNPSTVERALRLVKKG
jgi:hypothetical protein